MKTFWTVAILALLLVAYLAGYWPERGRRTALEGQLGEAQARVRLGNLLGQVLALTDVAAKGNYGQAQELASAFFDEARAEWARAPQSGFSAALEKILGVRDSVTADLTRGDPVVLERLQQIQVELRDALGYSSKKLAGAARQGLAGPRGHTPAEDSDRSSV